MRDLKRFGALAVAAFVSAAAVAQADVVYDSTQSGTDAIVQQYGNNFYYVGDTATPTGGGRLGTIGIKVGSSYYNPAGSGAAFTYTPNLTLDLYSSLSDANDRVNALGSASVSNVSFSNDGVVSGPDFFNYQDEKLVVFDFLAQNITLGSSIVFAIRDNVTSPGDAANGLSIGLTTSGPTVGSSGLDFFYTSPNGGSTTATTFAGYNVAAQITTAVPAPVSAMSASVLLTALAGRRRR